MLFGFADSSFRHEHIVHELDDVAPVRIRGSSKMSTTFKISERDRFPGQITSLAHITTANKIVKDRLTPKQLEMFRRTVFGRFVDIDLVLNSPLIHHMLLREVKDQRANSMSFSVKGMVVTFSKDEFLLMTGLWQVPTQVVQNKGTSEELERKYFGNRSKSTPLYINIMEEKYKLLEFENDDDAVKITLVYYTEVAMMGKNKQKSVVDHKLFEDVEVLEYYNSMDWGNIIWERTLEALKTALNNKVVVYKKKVKLNKNFIVKYSLRGFPHAFQVWTYEILSSVAGKIATRRSKVAVPRILRWSCSHSMPFRVLQRDIFESPNMIVNSVLIMSDVEKEFRDTPVDRRPVYERGKDGDREDDGDDDDQGGVNDNHNDNEDGDDTNNHHDLDNLDTPEPTYTPNVEHINDSRMGHVLEEDDNVDLPTPLGHEEERSEPSNFAHREGVSQANAAPNVDFYLQNIDSSVSSLEGRVLIMEGDLSHVKEDLAYVKAQLATIMSLLHSLCKGRSTVDVDKHTTPITKTSMFLADDATISLMPRPVLDVTVSLTTPLVPNAIISPIQPPMTDDTISPTSTLIPEAIVSSTRHSSLKMSRSSTLPLIPEATISSVMSPTKDATRSPIPFPVPDVTKSLPTLPLAHIKTKPIESHLQTPQLEKTIKTTPPIESHIQTPPVEIPISTPHSEMSVYTLPVLVPSEETILEPLPLAGSNLIHVTRDPLARTFSRRDDRKRKKMQLDTPTTTQVEKNSRRQINKERQKNHG